MISPKFKHVIKKTAIVLFTTLLPTVIGVICTQQTAKTWFKGFLPFDTFPFLYRPLYQVIIIITICVVIPVIFTILVELSNLNANEKLAQLYNKLLAYIQHSVDLKKKRFYREIGKHTSGGAIFSNITQPILQIEDLCSGLCNILSDYCGVSDIKGTVITCRDGKLKDYLAVCGDEQPTTSISELSKGNSLAKKALGSRTICVAEEASKDKNFYHPTGCNICSAICLPIFRGSDINMIVCMTSKTKAAFKRSNIKQYRQIFSYFESRMLLESYLLELKTKTTKLQ